MSGSAVPTARPLRDAVKKLTERGWQVVRLEPQGKMAFELDWPNLVRNASDFQRRDNVGARFGPQSNHLVDLDLDYPQARKLVGRPAFGLNDLVEFGRSSLPAGERGHRLVRCPDGPNEHRPFGIRRAAAKAAMEARGLKLTVLEVRGSNGTQTAFPPSIVKGDALVWSSPEGSAAELPEMSWAELNRRAGILAFCAFAAALFPSEGRDDFCFALYGALAEGGVDAEVADRMVVEVAALSEHEVAPNTLWLQEPPDDGLKGFLAAVGMEVVEPILRPWLGLQPATSPDTAAGEGLRDSTSGESSLGAYEADDLRRMLDPLDPVDATPGYYDFRDMLFAAHHATGGATAAREVFVTWAARNPEYAKGTRDEHGKLWSDIVRGLWNRAGKDHSGSAITVATILRALIDAGHHDVAGEFLRRDAGEDFEDEDVEVVAEGAGRHDVAGLSFLRADDVEAKPLYPLWPGRMFIGKLTTLAGMPDQGKSVVTCDITARVTRGDEWPDASGRAPEGSVIILSAEDDPADTIKPRLMAAGAVMEKVYILNSLVTLKKGKRMFSIAEDVARLTAFVQQHPDVRALIVDPANAYMGTSKEHDSFRDSDVRAVLGPLKEWAEEHQIAVLIITHFKKGGTGRAIDQVMGSLAFTALSRSAWAFIEEKDGDGKSTGRKVMAKIKQNITEAVDALAYSLVGVEVATGISAPRVAWGEVVKGNADDVMGGAKARPAEKLALAIAFLRSELEDGPVPAGVIAKSGRDAGFSEKTLHRAKVEIGAVSEQTKSVGWVWRLPEPGDEFDEE